MTLRFQPMSTFEKPKRVEKPWGYELWWAQTERYLRSAVRETGAKGYVAESR